MWYKWIPASFTEKTIHPPRLCRATVISFLSQQRRMLTQTVSLHSHSCCKLIALKKEWESLGLKKQVNLCMCSSPDFYVYIFMYTYVFYVYISRASAEICHPGIFCIRLHSHWCQVCSPQSSEWNFLLSQTLSTAKFDLPSNRVLMWFFYFVKSMSLNGSWHLEILCLSYWAPYDQHHMLTDENRSYCELKYIQSRVKLV